MKPDQQDESPSRAVTSARRRPGTPAAERKRLQRERDGQLVYQTEDWRLFIDLQTLSQKAGCQPEHLRHIVLKELVDNALDAGAGVSLEFTDETWIVRDDGPGLNLEQVPRLFCVNRPLLSSKLMRLPLRGMLGNGLRVVLGAVAATDGKLAVETRGHRLELAVCRQTGATIIVRDEQIARRPGVTVSVSLGPGDRSDGALARASITAAGQGEAYAGPSSPWWYGTRDFHKLFSQVTPVNTTVGAICRSLGLAFTDERAARGLSREEVQIVLERLRSAEKPVPPEKLGFIGKGYRAGCLGYGRTSGTHTTQSGAELPYLVEAWVDCDRPRQRGQGGVGINMLINRSMTVATIHATSWPGTMTLLGCGLDRQVDGPGTGDYSVLLSVIVPHLQLATDGKEPSLKPFSEAIALVLRTACGAAHRAMHRPCRDLSLKEAA